MTEHYKHDNQAAGVFTTNMSDIPTDLVSESNIPLCAQSENNHRRLYLHTSAGCQPHTTPGHQRHTTSGHKPHTTSGRQYHTTSGHQHHTTSGRQHHTTSGHQSHRTSGRQHHTTSGENRPFRDNPSDAGGLVMASSGMNQVMNAAGDNQRGILQIEDLFHSKDESASHLISSSNPVGHPHTAMLSRTYSPETGTSHSPRKPHTSSSISVPMYPRPQGPQRKSFPAERDSACTPSILPVRQVPGDATMTKSFDQFTCQLPFENKQRSDIDTIHQAPAGSGDATMVPQSQLGQRYSHVMPSYSRSQPQGPRPQQGASAKPSPSRQLFGEPSEVNPSRSNDGGSRPRVQSPGDSLGSVGPSGLTDDGKPMNFELIDLRNLQDGDLKTVMGSMVDWENSTVTGSCGSSPASSSTPSPSSQTHNMDTDVDTRNTEGEINQKIRKQSSIFRTKYFPVGSTLSQTKKSLQRALPKLKPRVPSSTVSSSDDGVPCVSPGPDGEQGNCVEGTDQVACMKKELFCQVCGDVAAGFYCGAYICEACKKFFVRASRQEKVKFVCHKSEDCVITKETRVRCQHCRYQKCLTLHMYSPGDSHGKDAVAGISNIPCRVCGGASSGFHFGALTCEGCKGFFRRMAKEREWHSYKCSKEDRCEISMLTRNVCKACRYRKCLDAGMSVEASRIGRQPNAIKHAISIEARKQGKRTSDADPVAKDPSPPPIPLDIAAFTRVHRKTTLPLVKKKLDMEVIDNTIKLVKEAWNELSSLNMPNKICFNNYELNCNDLQNTWKTIMVHFEFNAKCVIKFSKKLPNFQSLSLQDQVSLIQMATYSLCILNHCQFYNLEKKEYRFFDFTPEEEEAILRYFPQFKIIPKHFHHFGMMVKSKNFDDTELAFLSSLVLLNSENLTMTERDRVDAMSSDLLDSLQVYIKRHHTNYEGRMGYLLLRISELAMATLQHNQCVGVIAQAHPELQNQLWDEMYLK
ncbi:uncharacterized protein LOC124140669 [Haliotis rufescens]|uniref:uncharacterized protein LOC124140669 n=1 Tax=Haliotis rufescens TaxID=6454 RepID=UPI00201E8713|nr:uncharacterized protein LOC124140669 [Haliotis rufescens]